MSKKNELPFLIELLDDPSEEIRAVIVKELESFGVSLEEEIRNLDIKLDDSRKEVLNSLFEKNDRKWLRKIWRSVYQIKEPMKSLETGLQLICDFQNGRFSNKNLPGMLDSLAAEFLSYHKTPDHFKLVFFLFHQKKLVGAQKDYYNPLNSNLVYVIEKGLGIPISLVAVLMLVGARIGLHYEGCNFPGHFLARFRNPEDDEAVLVDCFNGGQLIYEQDLESFEKDSFSRLIDGAFESADAGAMLRRVLGNLMHAYKKNGDTDNSEFFESLLSISD